MRKNVNFGVATTILKYSITPKNFVILTKILSSTLISVKREKSDGERKNILNIFTSHLSHLTFHSRFTALKLNLKK